MIRAIRPLLLRVAAVTLAVTVVTAPLHAQFFTIPVFDASNYFEDLVQAADLAQQIANIKRGPSHGCCQLDWAFGCALQHVLLPEWGFFNPMPTVFRANPASPILSALNGGTPEALASEAGGRSTGISHLDVLARHAAGPAAETPDRRLCHDPNGG